MEGRYGLKRVTKRAMFAAAGNRTQDHPAHSLVTILIDLSGSALSLSRLP